MNKDKRNNIQLLGTLNNADESGIIANANQIYDANEDKSTQDVSKEHKERIETLETKESSMQTTLENITKTGEASAASNVTYNHSDSKLDATNVQQAIDEVRKRSNYNDGDNIIDFNTIHIITDNPEFVIASVDANDRILYGIKADGQPYWGIGVPKVVRNYVDKQVNDILGTDNITETIDSLKEVEKFLSDFKNSDTLKALLDTKANKTDVDNTIAAVNADIIDIYKKSNPNDEEGNVIDTNTIVSIEDNPEYIKVITDNVGKLIEAIGLDGIRKFFAGIEVQGTLQCITDNPEYIAVWLDNQERIVFGFKINGDPYFGYGIPSQINSVIELLKSNTKTRIDTLQQSIDNNILDLKANVDEVRATTDDIYKKSNPNDEEGNIVDTNTIFSIEDNPEYIKAFTDSVGKLIEAIGLDGVRKFFAGINVQGTLQCVTDNPEYIALWLDNQNRIVLGFKTNGDTYFGYGVPSQINSLIETLKSNAETRIDVLQQSIDNNILALDYNSDTGELYALTGETSTINASMDDNGDVYLEQEII